MGARCVENERRPAPMLLATRHMAILAAKKRQDCRQTGGNRLANQAAFPITHGKLRYRRSGFRPSPNGGAFPGTHISQDRIGASRFRRDHRRHAPLRAGVPRRTTVMLDSPGGDRRRNCSSWLRNSNPPRSPFTSSHRGVGTGWVTPIRLDRASGGRRSRHCDET